MCLWDEVLEWDAQRIRLRARNHTGAAHPLRVRGRLPAVALCEYGAQAMAVHGGLLASAQGGRAAAGVLVALRGIELAVARLDDLYGALDGEAELLAAGEASQQYAFRLLHEGRLLARGRATAKLLASPESTAPPVAPL
ncbi:phosphotransferase [Pseudoxanthomonas koreensis]|uniref:phosphotransferase n=1 Tax=Pseudoxanthomonas koreensis TaxID=266061 RepID=UPI0013917C85|nr:phosphotransferase [Pseudoxanthomonas koreensis]KAF1692150.1 phosphotransferase [Pseudoxanthomonas koreensis]